MQYQPLIDAAGLGYHYLFDAAAQYGKSLCIIVDELDVASSGHWIHNLELPHNPPPNLQFIWGSRPMKILVNSGLRLVFYLLQMPTLRL
jgi:hypothetical protein